MTVAPRHDQYKDGWDTGVLVEVSGFFMLFSSQST